MSERIAVMTADSIILDGATLHRHRAFSRAVDIAAASRKMGISQMWIHPTCTDQLDWEPDRNCDYGSDAADSWWIRAFLHGADGVYGGVDLVRPDKDPSGTWRDVPSGELLSQALCLVRGNIGLVWRRVPATMGLNLLKHLHKGPRTISIEHITQYPEPALRGGTEHSMSFLRPLTTEEQARRYLHSYDINGQFLAACSSLAIGLGDPTHADAMEVARIMARRNSNDKPMPLPPAYWRCHIEYRAPDLLPLPYHADTRGGMVWVTTPTLNLLRELGADIGITEAWYWLESHRLFEPWYKVLRDARSNLMASTAAAAPYALNAVKSIYAATLGLIGSKQKLGVSDPLFHPDWRHANVAQARANAYRRLVKAAALGVYPFAVGADCFYITSDEPDPVKTCPDVWPLGPGLGQFKVKDSVPLADALPYLGRLRRLEEHLNDVRRVAA